VGIDHNVAKFCNEKNIWEYEIVEILIWSELSLSLTASDVRLLTSV
jgi:hypothetical protein